MDLVDGLKAFVATARTGSFTAAAEQLGVSNRLTSKYVAALEARLGVRLLQRTTRKVGVTASGADLLARAPALLDELDGLIADVSETSRGFTGTIRLSAPVTFGELYVAGMAGRFLKAHPELTISLHLSDAYTDLATQGIDVAIRVGATEVLSVKSRKLGDLAVIAAAAPDYVNRQGSPATPADLAQHACIVDTNRRAARTWRFFRNGQDHHADVAGRIEVNSARAACALAVAGHGITYGPTFAVQDALAAQTLVPVLTDFEADRIPVSAVYLEGRTLPRKIRALIDFAQEDYRRAFARASKSA